MPDADDAGQDQPVLLVVEDDFLVRLTLVDGLSDAGFRVLEAGDALAALGLLATRREILAMLTDINLPGVADGYALAHAARVLRPDLPVVYASGRYGAMAEQRAVPGARFLAKPFAASLAAQVLREALGHAGKGGPIGPPGSPGAAGTLPPP
ncbi:MAG: response regulator [Acetobacteraceae bacterium]|nr:response regulator [Acetobacteraceae bacterium]